MLAKKLQRLYTFRVNNESKLFGDSCVRRSLSPAMVFFFNPNTLFEELKDVDGVKLQVIKRVQQFLHMKQDLGQDALLSSQAGFWKNFARVPLMQFLVLPCLHH